MADVEEAAGARAVDDLVEGVGLRGGGISIEGDVNSREAMVVSRGLAAGLVADVLIRGAAVVGFDRASRLGG